MEGYTVCTAYIRRPEREGCACRNLAEDNQPGFNLKPAIATPAGGGGTSNRQLYWSSCSAQFPLLSLLTGGSAAVSLNHLRLFK